MNQSLSEPSTSASMLQRAKDGDVTIWRLLAHVYGPIIYGWVRRSGFQSADAADIMQETLLSVSEAISRFDHQREGATFRGWLWTITRNKIRDRARAKRLDAEGGTDAQIEIQQIANRDDPPSEASEDQTFAQRRMLELLREKFDPRSWQMFWETSIIGRDPQDVADDLGVTRWAVYKSRARVLQRLKREIAGLE